MNEYKSTGKIGDVTPENFTQAQKVAMMMARRQIKMPAWGNSHG
jgi:hypothetical protein